MLANKWKHSLAYNNIEEGETSQDADTTNVIKFPESSISSVYSKCMARQQKLTFKANPPHHTQTSSGSSRYILVFLLLLPC